MTTENEVAKPAPNQTRSRHILIVDDEPIVVMMIRIFLEKQTDSEILGAFNGEDALRTINGQPLDLLITDYNMPGIDGLTLATRLRRLHPGLPVIFITATARDDHLRQQAAVLAAPILEKPLDFDELDQLIHQSL
jgi:CheY-like chemotaxis protein